MIDLTDCNLAYGYFKPKVLLTSFIEHLYKHFFCGVALKSFVSIGTLISSITIK